MRWVLRLIQTGMPSGALAQTPIVSAMWNRVVQRIQRAANLQIRIEAQFAPEPRIGGWDRDHRRDRQLPGEPANE
jgi:hypothetical protein